VQWWGRGAWSCYFDSKFGSKSQQVFWRQTRQHLLLYCRFFSYLTSFLGTHSVSGAVKLRAERTHPRNISNRAKAESAMVRSRSMRLLLRQPKYTGVLESNSPPLMPAMPLLPLLLSPYILLQQYSILCPFFAPPTCTCSLKHLF